jgi:hypothetical protein
LSGRFGPPNAFSQVTSRFWKGFGVLLGHARIQGLVPAELFSCKTVHVLLLQGRLNRVQAEEGQDSDRQSITILDAVAGEQDTVLELFDDFHVRSLNRV